MIIFALKEIFIISWRHFNCCTCLPLRITSLCCNALPHTHKHIHTPCFNCFQLNAFSFAFFTQYKLHLLLYNFTAHTHTHAHIHAPAVICMQQHICMCVYGCVSLLCAGNAFCTSIAMFLLHSILLLAFQLLLHFHYNVVFSLK